MAQRVAKASFLSLLILAVVAALIIASVSTLSRGPSVAQARPEPLPSADVEGALRHIGATPELLTAAGLSAQAITALIEDADAHLESNGTAWSSALGALGTARSNFTRLDDLVRSGVATEQQVTELAAAKTALANAETAMATQRTSLWAAIDENFPGQEVVAAVQAAHAASEQALPREFLFVSHTEAQYVALRNAWANERISAARGIEPDQAAQQLLATERAKTAVSTAALNLTNNLNANTAAWNQAITATEQE